MTIDDAKKSIFLRTLAAAILANVPAMASTHINQIFPTLSNTLDLNQNLLPLDKEMEHFQIEVDVENNQIESTLKAS